MDINFLSDLFQGISSFFLDDAVITFTRIGLIALGGLLIFLGYKGILEAMIMIPMGLGMMIINASVLKMPDGEYGNIFLEPLLSDPLQLIEVLQIDWLQPIYTFTFSNGLIACFIFMGIGTLLDVGYILRRPFTSMTLAFFAELGTFIVIPLALFMGLSWGEAASVATVGGADGPMVLFTSLRLAPNLFVPITVVAYLYLGLTYGGYPYLIRALIPKKLRGIPSEKLKKEPKPVSSGVKILMAATLCLLLCLLFPIASPLMFSLFLGIIIKESGLKNVLDFIQGPLLYGSTFLLGILLGILCEAHLLLNPAVLKLLVLGIIALFFSGVGGIIGGYFMFFLRKGKFNPTIGIAAISCIPTSAKLVQKEVTKANPNAIVLPDALGANITGVISSAIIAGLLITIVPLL